MCDLETAAGVSGRDPLGEWQAFLADSYDRPAMLLYVDLSGIRWPDDGPRLHDEFESCIKRTLLQRKVAIAHMPKDQRKGTGPDGMTAWWDLRTGSIRATRGPPVSTLPLARWFAQLREFDLFVAGRLWKDVEKITGRNRNTVRKAAETIARQINPSAKPESVWMDCHAAICPKCCKGRTCGWWAGLRRLGVPADLDRTKNGKQTVKKDWAADRKRRLERPRPTRRPPQNSGT